MNEFGEMWMKTYDKAVLSAPATGGEKLMLTVSQHWGRQFSTLGACLVWQLPFQGGRSQLHFGCGTVSDHLVNYDKDLQDSENCLKQ